MTAPLQRYLEHDDGFARLQDHARRLMRAQALLTSQLPPALRESCSVANLKDGTLVVFAANGTAAARLRQLVPTLLAGFGAAGLPLAEIKLRVRIEDGSVQADTKAPRILTEAARTSLESLAATLPADSPLRDSVDRLLARSRSEKG